MNVNRDALALKFQQGKEKLAGLTGRKRLVFLLKLDLLKVAKFYSRNVAEGLIDENFDLIERSNTEEAAILLTIKAYLSSLKVDIDEAKIIVDKALRMSRDIGSRQTEAMALAIKGYHKDTERQHEKAAILYIMALENIPEIYKADVLRELGTSYGKQGKYDLAWYYFNKTIEQTEKMIRVRTASEDVKTNQLEIQAVTWSWLATIYESIDDFDGAEKAHDKAIKMAIDNEFTWGKYRALSGKVKLFFLRGDFVSAEKYLLEAENLRPAEYDPRADYYIAHDWARLYRFSSDCQKALDKYEVILYGGSNNKEVMDSCVLTLMKNMAIMFDEVINGVYECLMAAREKDKNTLAVELSEKMQAYNSILNESGIYIEIDKQTKLGIERRNLINVLERIFQKSRKISYGDIIAEFDPAKGKAKVINIKSGKEFWINKRAFLIFEKLHIHRGKCVTRKEIEVYWEQNQEAFNPADSGFPTSLNRDVKKKLGLAPFIIKCLKPQGWKLLP